MRMDTTEFDKLAVKEAGITGSERTTNAYLKLKAMITEHPEYCLANYPELIAESAKLLARVEKINGKIDLGYIRSEDTRDSVLAYRNILQATQDVFGKENMTEDVMIAAIQAASYTAYRNIMGQAAQSKRY